VADWVVRDDPGVHVDAAGLDEDAFGRLEIETVISVGSRMNRR
jgi:hypothetical protein